MGWIVRIKMERIGRGWAWVIVCSGLEGIRLDWANQHGLGRRGQNLSDILLWSGWGMDWSERIKMERALIIQYESDMKAALAKLTPDTKDAIVALAELPLQIRGFGPVKALNEAKAAKRREELLSIINMGGAPMTKAAE